MQETIFDWIIAIVVFAVLEIALLAVLDARQAHAHDWYDYECCSGKDCAPVEDGVVEERADGVHVKGFSQVLKYDDHRLHWSKDDRDHVCNMGDALLCVYRKPKGM